MTLFSGSFYLKKQKALDSNPEWKCRLIFPPFKSVSDFFIQRFASLFFKHVRSILSIQALNGKTIENAAAAASLFAAAAAAAPLLLLLQFRRELPCCSSLSLSFLYLSFSRISFLCCGR